MSQRSLFDLPDQLPPDAIPSRMARRTDPATSHAAAAEYVASGANAHQRAECLRVLRELGGWWTSDEIAFHAGMERHAAARRRPELERAGQVERGPARVSRVGKRRGVTWRAL